MRTIMVGQKFADTMANDDTELDEIFSAAVLPTKRK